MGCVQAGGHHVSGNYRKQSFSSNAVDSNQDKESLNPDIIGPDPDLGWRRVKASLAQGIPSGAAAGVIHSEPLDWVSSVDIPQATAQEYPSKGVWTVHFLNERSGHVCHVSLLTLAINICVRAERLAEAFGVVVEHIPGVNVSQSCLKLPEGETNKQVYSSIGIPDFGWELLRREINPQELTGSENIQTMASPVPSQKKRGGTQGALESGNTLQLLKWHGRKVMADVATIGMNIAEQLYRLERKQDDRHFLPTDPFAWSIPKTPPASGVHTAVCMTDRDALFFQVKNPKGETVWLVAEEMIMNVTHWVQQTYLTSVVF